MSITRLISEYEMWNVLLSLTQKDGQKSLAKSLKISPQYLCDVLQEKRKISDKLAEKLGYKKLVYFKKVNR